MSYSTNSESVPREASPLVTSIQPPSAHGPLPKLVGWGIVFLASCLSFTRLMDSVPFSSANDRSRWCTVWSLTEKHTYQIDEAIRRHPDWDTIDKVRHNDHFYSSKPPILSWMVSWVYRGVKLLTSWSLDRRPIEASRTILLFVNLVPFVIALVYWDRLLRVMTRSSFTYLFGLVAIGFGTLQAPFLNSLNNHSQALTGLMFALHATVLIHTQTKVRPQHYFWAGLCTGYVCANELTAMGLVFGFGLILGRQSLLKTFVYYLPGLLLPMFLFEWTNFDATGGWAPFYSAYGTEKYRYVLDGVPSYWMNPKGLDRNLDDPATYIMHCLIGHHGLFSLSPVLFVSLLGICAALAGQYQPKMARKPGERALRTNYWRTVRKAVFDPSEPLRPFHWLGTLLTIVVFVFYMTRVNHYNYGGVSVGLRWMLWLTPFWMLALVPAFDRITAGWKLRGPAAALLAMSIFSAWYPWNGPWQQPWTYHLLRQGGWINYDDPVPTFPLPHYSWVATLPVSPERDPDYWTEWTSVDSQGESLALRLSDGGPIQSEGHTYRELLVQHKRAGKLEREEKFVLDSKLFNSGKELTDCLPSTKVEDSPPPAQTVAFFQGLPSSTPYQAQPERPYRVAIRKDAFWCQPATASAIDKESGSTVRRDVWYSAEVPFGVLHWDVQVFDTASSALYSRSRFFATSSGLILKTPKTAEPADRSAK